jgi:ABC-type antimicrobial peptide transport system ATPase subunit
MKLHNEFAEVHAAWLRRPGIKYITDLQSGVTIKRRGDKIVVMHDGKIIGYIQGPNFVRVVVTNSSIDGRSQ